MVVWKHLECENAFDDGQVSPIRCPNDVIEPCPNPTAGFELRCPNANPKVWKCTACGWIEVGDSVPQRCLASPDLECQNPTDPDFEKLCD